MTSKFHCTQLKNRRGNVGMISIVTICYNRKKFKPNILWFVEFPTFFWTDMFETIISAQHRKVNNYYERGHQLRRRYAYTVTHSYLWGINRSLFRDLIQQGEQSYPSLLKSRKKQKEQTYTSLLKSWENIISVAYFCFVSVPCTYLFEHTWCYTFYLRLQFVLILPVSFFYFLCVQKGCN